MGSDTGEFKIAVVAPLSGRGAVLGREMVQAAQMALDDCLEAEGIPGIRLGLWTLNDKGNEREGMRIARQVIEEERVLAIVGHYNSNVTLRAAPIYCEGHLPLVAPIVSNPKLTESGWNNTFRFTNRDDVTAAVLAGYLVQRLGKRRAVVIETNTVYGHSMSEEFVLAFQRAGGRILSRLQVAEGLKEFAAVVGNWPPDFDVAFYGGTFEGAPLLQAMRTGTHAQLLATGDGCWDMENFLRPAGAATELGEGVLVLSACEQVGQVPGSQAFAARYEAQFGPIVNYAPLAYDATTWLIEAIKVTLAENPMITRRDLMRTLKQVSYHGIAYSDAVKLDSCGDNLAAVTVLHTVSGGQFRQVHAVGRSPTRAITDATFQKHQQ